MQFSSPPADTKVNHSQQAIFAQVCFTHSNGQFLSFVYIVVLAFYHLITGAHWTALTYLSVCLKPTRPRTCRRDVFFMMKQQL